MCKSESPGGWLGLQTRIQEPTKPNKNNNYPREMPRKTRRHFLQIILLLWGS